MSNSSPDPSPFGAPSNDPFAANPYAPTSETAGQSLASDDVEAYRRTYLKHEASCKSIGTLYLLGAIFLTPMGLFVVVASFVEGFGDPENIFVLFIGLLYLVIGLAQGAVGIGLRRLNETARIGGVILSTIGLLGIPIGTLISAYFLYLLLSEKGRIVFSPHYKDVIAQTPHIKYKTPLVVWILLLVIVGLIVGAVILGVNG